VMVGTDKREKVKFSIIWRMGGEMRNWISQGGKDTGTGDGVSVVRKQEKTVWNTPLGKWGESGKYRCWSRINPLGQNGRGKAKEARASCRSTFTRGGKKRRLMGNRNVSVLWKAERGAGQPWGSKQG